MKYFYNKLMYKITRIKKYKCILENEKRKKEIFEHIDLYLNNFNTMFIVEK